MNASDERTASAWTKGDSDLRGLILPSAKPPRASERCDTAIIGSGIAGLSVAYELAEAGQSVVALDRGLIGGGMTARTTAHLAPICDDGIANLIEMRGEHVARLFHSSQAAAVDRVQEIVRRHTIDCGFRRLDAFLFPALERSAADAGREIDREYGAALALGLDVERVRGVPMKGLSQVPALRYGKQAAFHPLRYLQGLACAVIEAGGRLYAEAAVTDIDQRDAEVVLRLAGDERIVAQQIVVATNAPVSNLVALHSKMAPYRSYALAFELNGASLPDALYWDTAVPYHYVRLHPVDGGAVWLIVGGEDHRSGEADDGAQRFGALEAWIRGLVPELGPEIARWSGQILETNDYCGYIGRNPGSSRIWVATGDSGQGLTHGVLAGLLLRQQVLGQLSPWAEVYAPSRKTAAGAANYLRENMVAVRNLAEYLTGSEIDSPEKLSPGQGGILRRGLKKIAAARDRDGALHVHSASCTHLGCIVHWNSTEQCWDCPCHGSQFAPDGTVLNGPALRSLNSADLDGE